MTSLSRTASARATSVSTGIAAYRRSTDVSRRGMLRSDSGQLPMVGILPCMAMPSDGVVRVTRSSSNWVTSTTFNE